MLTFVTQDTKPIPMTHATGVAGYDGDSVDAPLISGQLESDRYTADVEFDSQTSTSTNPGSLETVEVSSLEHESKELSYATTTEPTPRSKREQILLARQRRSIWYRIAMYCAKRPVKILLVVTILGMPIAIQCLWIRVSGAACVCCVVVVRPNTWKAQLVMCPLSLV